MPRDRHQDGWVEETGKIRKKWKGHYFVYIREADGKERRAHRSIMLGPKAGMKKWEAEEKLREIIAVETANPANKVAPATLGWFWTNRYRPLKEPTWKASSAPKVIWFIDNHVVGPFRDVLLADLNRFELQKHTNELAVKFSSSVVKQFRVYVKAILDEAMEQDFITKNPARKLDVPNTRKPANRALSVDEIASLLACMEGRDRLIVRMAIVLGLRPGELFALRCNDVTATALRVDESNSATGVGSTKTDASSASVWLPQPIAVELQFWMGTLEDVHPEALIFPSKNNTPISANNFLKRTLKTAAQAAGLTGVTFQALRRTCATHMQHEGSVKDVQAHLRHAHPNVTAQIYMQSIPASVALAVEALDRKLRSGEAKTTEGGGVN